MKKAPDLSFFGHLNDLSGRVLKSIAAIAVCSVFCYIYIDAILSFVIQPVGRLYFTSPADAFTARILLSIICGSLCALPVVLYQIWQFVSSGLKESEKKHVALFGPLSLFLFMTGGSFAYFVVVPIATTFLLGFATELISPMITIKNYISFVGTMILAFGCIFEIPLVLMFLAKIGIATPDFLIQKRKHAIVIMFIVSAIITPPDVVTQLIMAGPLVLLYELGIIFVRMASSQQEKGLDVSEKI